MRPRIRFVLFPLISALLLAVAPLSAQQIRFYPNFNTPSTSRMRLNGSAGLRNSQSQLVLRVTDDADQEEASAAYFTIQQQVNLGFTTWFQFQVHNPMTCCQPGGGFSFILQNSNATDPTMGASGSGITALGAGGDALGYSGINNSLAVEFDIFGDPWDPNSNHVAVQSCGGGNNNVFNTPVHLPGVYTIGSNNNVTSCLLSSAAINTSVPTLGGTCNGDSCTDGAVHQVVIQYTPSNNLRLGVLQVWLDPEFIPGTHTPVPNAPTIINVPYNIVYTAGTNPLGLTLNNNSLWVGFTAGQPAPAGGKKPGGGTPSGGTTTDIMAWEFTPHAPSFITQTIPPGGTQANYIFGGHQMAVTYPDGFSNPDGIQMTVLETPVNQQTFYTQRLLGTDFADENCIIYLQTGGNCVLYTVTCQDQNGNNVTCPEELPPNNPIAMCTKFYTNENVAVNNADFLKADPIGSNNWCSIFNGFSNNNDPVVSGKGTGFSDLVATFSTDGRGPACPSDGQSLQAVTKALEQKTKPPQGGSTYCPAIQDH